MNILYTCDNDYVWLMGISTISLFENNRHMADLVVYLLGENISTENKKCIQYIANYYKRKINVIDVPKLNIPEKLILGRWPLSAFTRLYAGELLPADVKEVLYLDCDTIIRGIIDENDFKVDDSHTFYGVKECIGARYKRNIGLKKDSIYINAGVIYLNLDNLRKKDVSNRLNRFMEKYADFANYADQDVLNGTFNGEIGLIPLKYDVMTIEATYSHSDIMKLRRPTNFYSDEELKKAVDNPSIIHYTTNMHIIRPWFSNSNHPFCQYFRKYMDMSPWKDRGMSEKNFGSFEDKVITVIGKLPKGMALRGLGFLHSVLRPNYFYIWGKLHRR